MLVKALRLRHLGQKLPKDMLHVDVPVVGEMRYEDQPNGRSSMVCLLMPVGGSTDPLVQMFGCRIKIEKRGLLIRGTEYVWQRKRRDSYPQAFAKTPKLTYHTNNARSEELAAKATFREPWKRAQRCIIPALSFDEPNWRAEAFDAGPETAT